MSEINVQSKIWDHDVRITKLETELTGIHTELRQQREDIKENKALASRVLMEVGKVAGQNKLILWIIGLAGALLSGLELWVVFR